MSKRVSNAINDRFVVDMAMATAAGKWAKKNHHPTVFHRITASPEVLAEKLTYWQYDPDQVRCGWTNNIIVGQLYKNYHEAIAATVAKLKEVCDAEGD